ncbi:MAG: CHASE3 domain-containing protein [Rubrivivax sp.]|nr:CHASE3 domain-containing protein [Rubrivivax sp.]
MKAALPPDELQRVDALRSCCVLDTPPEQAFDDLTALAAHICQVPIALVSLVDQRRQWFKSRVGLEALETPRDQAFCAHAILHPQEVLQVRDAQADPRFADNALVTSDPHIRFYAGAPLLGSDGHALGTLCVIDRQPRELDASQLSALRALARQAALLLEQRRARAAPASPRQGLPVPTSAPAPGPSGLRENAWFGAFMLAGLALVVVGVIAFRSLISYGAEARWVTHTRQVIESAGAVMTHLLDVETGQRGFVITGDYAYLQPYVGGGNLLDAEVRRLRELTSDNATQRQPVDALEVLAGRRLAIARHTVELRQATGLAEAQAYMLGGEGRDLMDQARAAVQGIVGVEHRLLARRELEMAAGARRTLVALGGVGGLSLLVMALAWVHIGNEVRRRKLAQAQIERLNADLESRATELAAASKRMRVVIDSAPNALVMADRDGRIALFNGQAERLFGHARAEMIGQPIETLMPERLRAGHSSQRDGFFADPQARAMGVGRDLIGLRKDGREVPIEVGLSPVTFDEGRFVLASIVDITQRKRADARLRAKNDELKGFAYTVSHDLKAPLRGISGYAQELERRHKAGLSERALFCIDQIITAAKNLDRLIEDLLKLSRLDTETPTFTEVPLADLVQSILRDRGHTLAEQGVELSLDVPPITLRTWERGLNQMLSNLIDNAVKYSRDARPPRLAIRAEVVAGTCRLSVADNGIGFDMKYHDRIFGLFNRLVRANEFEGTGAGLAIVKKLADKLGGSIRAEAAPGQGATFFVELPMAPAAESST